MYVNVLIYLTFKDAASNINNNRGESGANDDVKMWTREKHLIKLRMNHDIVITNFLCYFYPIRWQYKYTYLLIIHIQHTPRTPFISLARFLCTEYSNECSMNPL